MKKIVAILSLIGIFMMGTSQATYAQDDSTTIEQNDNDKGGGKLNQSLKKAFLDGGPAYMTPILVCLLLGLAIALERIISLNLATSNKRTLLSRVDAALEAGNIEEAQEIAKSTRGPVAGVIYQGLDRVNEGLDVVEKSISSYGSVLSGRLEKGLSWLSLFIAIAPMLGFMGTVIGMILAFKNIAKSGEVEVQAIAGDIQIALLTTVFGLITAIILQVFYNYIVSKVDSLINDMEDSSVSLVDMMVRYKLKG